MRKRSLIGAAQLFALAGFITAIAPRADGREYRADDGETVLVARQLDHVMAEVWNIEYPPPEALTHCPLDTTVDPRAQTFTYREWDVVGQSQIISNYAADLPRIDILVRETPQAIKDIGIAYGYTQADLRSAAFAGVSLDPMKARAAKESNERGIDEIIALGNSSAGFTGFLNHPNVPRVTVTNGAWLTTNANDPAKILADLNSLVAAVVTNTKNIHKPNALLLPLAHYVLISQLKSGTVSDMTVLDFFLKTSPYIKEVQPWYRLDTSGPSSAPMAMVYEKSPMNVRAVVPVPFEQMPPEVKNLEWVINCTSRVGGCMWVRPMAAVYGDGI